MAFTEIFVRMSSGCRKVLSYFSSLLCDNQQKADERIDDDSQDGISKKTELEQSSNQICKTESKDDTRRCSSQTKKTKRIRKKHNRRKNPYQFLQKKEEFTAMNVFSWVVRGSLDTLETVNIMQMQI